MNYLEIKDFLDFAHPTLSFVVLINILGIYLYIYRERDT